MVIHLLGQRVPSRRGHHVGREVTSGHGADSVWEVETHLGCKLPPPVAPVPGLCLRGLFDYDIWIRSVEA